MAGEPSRTPVRNDGEDFTRPLNRFDLRQSYERLPDAGPLEPAKWVTTLRADLRTDLSGGWTIYGRTDLPLVYAQDVTSSFNPAGHGRFGLGDLLTEIALIPPSPQPRLAYGVGLRIVWPTGARNEAGQGKYQVGPLMGVRWDLPEVSSGSFFLTQIRYQNSIASRDQNAEREDIDELAIQPKLNVSLPDGWFTTLFASEQIQVNLEDDGKLFVPFDLMVGRRLSESLVVSLEYSRSVYHDSGYEPFQWQIEGRVGYYF